MSELKRYGLTIGDGKQLPWGVSQFDIELACTREDRVETRYMLSKAEHMCRAMHLAWPDMQITSYVELQCEQWFEPESTKVMIGHASSGKTFVMSRIAWLDFLVDPFNTGWLCTSVSVPSLKKRLWSDIVGAMNKFVGHDSKESPALELPFKYNRSELFISNPHPNNADAEKVGFQGVATDNTASAVGKIQGLKLPRMRVLIDEGEDTGEAIYSALANLESTGDLRVVMLGNPKDKYSQFGSWWEPVGGFEAITEDDQTWKGKRDTTVLHFDGLKSPALEDSSIKGLLTQKSIDKIIARYGDDSMEYWMYVRGFPPPDGSWGKIMSQTAIDRCFEPLRFIQGTTFMAASLDPAFGGRDSPALMLSECGIVSGKDKLGFNCKEIIHIKFNVSSGRLIDEQLADKVLDKLEEWGVKPENFIMDTSGRGYSIQTLLRISPRFNVNFHAVDFGGKPTELTILDPDDPKKGKSRDVYDRFVTEIWYSAQEYMGHGLVGNLGPQFRMIRQDLNSRLYTRKGEKKISAEKKEDMRKRLGRSPDDGDAFCLKTHLLRLKGSRPGEFKHFHDRNQVHQRRAQAAQVSWGSSAKYSGSFYDNFRK